MMGKLTMGIIKRIESIQLYDKGSMGMEASKQTVEVSNYIGRLLRDNFGKGPEGVFVSIGGQIITCYIRNLISPTERVLLAQDQENTLQLTRDLVMATLIPEIKANIKLITGMEIQEFYYDWNLHNKTGLFVALSTTEADSNFTMREDYLGKEAIHQEIDIISKQAEKSPEEIVSYQLNPRTLVLIRNGILVSIEKQLIRQGLQEQLRIAKRKLEKTMLHNNNHFESILNTKVIDIFVDWDFDLDKSVIVFITNPTS
jgi:uncharacterized protein YbcI